MRCAVRVAVVFSGCREGVMAVYLPAYGVVYLRLNFICAAETHEKCSMIDAARRIKKGGEKVRTDDISFCTSRHITSTCKIMTDKYTGSRLYREQCEI